MYAQTGTRFGCALTAQLISAFVFAARILQVLYFLNLKFQASGHLLWLHSPVYVGTGRGPRGPVFSRRGAYIIGIVKLDYPGQPLVRFVFGASCCTGVLQWERHPPAIRKFLKLYKGSQNGQKGRQRACTPLQCFCF